MNNDLIERLSSVLENFEYRCKFDPEFTQYAHDLREAIAALSPVLPEEAEQLMIMAYKAASDETQATGQLYCDLADMVGRLSYINKRQQQRIKELENEYKNLSIWKDQNAEKYAAQIAEYENLLDAIDHYVTDDREFTQNLQNDRERIRGKQ